MTEPLAIKQAREWCEQIGSPLWPNMNESDWATLMRDVLAEYDRFDRLPAKLADRERLLDEIERALYGDVYGADSADFLARIKEFRDRLAAACEPCAECGHCDYRELDDILEERRVRP